MSNYEIISLVVSIISLFVSSFAVYKVNKISSKNNLSGANFTAHGSGNQQAGGNISTLNK